MAEIGINMFKYKDFVMLNEEIRKYLDILTENEQVDEIKLPKWAKGLGAAAALGTGMYMTSPDTTPFAHYLKDQIEQTQDPAARAQMKKDLDSFAVRFSEGDDTSVILKRYGWEKENEIPDWAKEPEQSSDDSEEQTPAKPGDVEFDYNQIDVKPTTARN